MSAYARLKLYPGTNMGKYVHMTLSWHKSKVNVKTSFKDSFQVWEGKCDDILSCDGFFCCGDHFSVTI